MENQETFTPRIENGNYVGSSKTQKVEEMDNRYLLNALKKTIRETIPTFGKSMERLNQISSMKDEVVKVLSEEIIRRLAENKTE